MTAVSDIIPYGQRLELLTLKNLPVKAQRESAIPVEMSLTTQYGCIASSGAPGPGEQILAYEQVEKSKHWRIFAPH